MKAAQARASVETARDIQNDKTLKSKAEKERRLREKHSNNTKIFIDERKTAAMRQAKRREKIRKLHENQVNDLQKYIQAVSQELCRVSRGSHDAQITLLLKADFESAVDLAWERYIGLLALPTLSG